MFAGDFRTVLDIFITSPYLKSPAGDVTLFKIFRLEALMTRSTLQVPHVGARYAACLSSSSFSSPLFSPPLAISLRRCFAHLASAALFSAA